MFCAHKTLSEPQIQAEVDRMTANIKLKEINLSVRAKQRNE